MVFLVMNCFRRLNGLLNTHIGKSVDKSLLNSSLPTELTSTIPEAVIDRIIPIKNPLSFTRKSFTSL